MLTIEDDSTIRHAIWKRLSAEPGVILHKFDDIGIRARKERPRRSSLRKETVGIDIQVTMYVQPIVGIETGCVLKLTSAIQAPAQFEHSALLNEIDELAEQVKAARRQHNGVSVNIINDNVQLKGNG